MNAHDKAHGHFHPHDHTHARSSHGNSWILRSMGMVAGLVLLVYLPSLPGVSSSWVLGLATRVVGGIVLVATAWYGFLRSRLRKRDSVEIPVEHLSFGWDPGWTGGLGVTALVLVSGAAVIEVGASEWWPVAWLFLANSGCFFVGYLLMRGYRRKEFALLPMFDLGVTPESKVLDAGCGAGRTIVAFSRGHRVRRIVAFDRFDADYIDDGGKPLLERNLAIASLTGAVEIQPGDLTKMPFADGYFDAVVSTNVYDHLGSGKEAGMQETFRVLRSGGRFLVGLSVPGWAMFSVGNLISLFLMSRKGWRLLSQRTGFDVLDEGVVNGTWFLLLGKPAAPAKGLL